MIAKAEYSNDFDTYLHDVMEALRVKYTNVSVNRYAFLCEFFCTLNGQTFTTKVKNETLIESSLKNKLPLSIRNLLK
jgi:hypothetical protein